MKFNKKENRWRNIRAQCKQTGETTIKLAMMNEHVFLNESVEGVSSFALKNYKEIDEKCNNKTDEEKLMIYCKRNERFQISKIQAHIKSYQLLDLIVDNKLGET